MTVNGEKAGTVVLPHRGVANWDDWGASNLIPVRLNKGTNTITLEYRPENSNMNLNTNHAVIDGMVVTFISGQN